MSQAKDFSTVSPSAKSLLLMKGYTNIPYAREAAALMQGPEVFGLDFENKDFWFWIRVMHFESRYWSIDQLMKETGNNHILELSSGYSFRGLDMCSKNAGIHYIDTDLPGIVATKKQMIDELHLENNLQGKFELLPLNVLDETAFGDTVDRFGDGPVTIVNEGLLMYLNTDEKKQLCRIIHSILTKRGGCWITADIYVQRSAEMRASLPQSKSEAAFMEQHHIEENKFASYDAARDFFAEQGFEVVKEATPNYAQLSIMPKLLEVLPPEMRQSKEPPPKIQATWMLRTK